MLYLVGLGLDKKSLSLKGKGIISRADKIYLESYTVDFPYSIRELEKVLSVKIEKIGRNKVESDKLMKEAKNKDVVLMVYGSPLMATTHISLILDCKEKNVNYKIIENASIFNAVLETGLQAYKFGKIASMPDWSKKGKTKSFIEIIKQNKKINSHTLLLIDIGLSFKNALNQLEKVNVKLDKLIVCSQLGTEKGRFYYDKIKKMGKLKIKKPFCFILPGKLHFQEKKALNKLKEK